MPSESTLGFIHSTLSLDRADYTFYGTESLVSGTASLTFVPSAQNRAGADIFGPLVVNVVFEGRLNAKVRVDRGTRETSMVYSYREDRTLFRRQLCLHAAPARLSSNQEMAFPFSISFPDHADPRPPAPGSSKPGEAEASSAHTDDRISSEDELPDYTTAMSRQHDATSRSHDRLPPSFQTSLHGSLANCGEIDVKYRVFLEAQMPGLDIRVVSRGGDRTISYIPPNLQLPLRTGQFSHDFVVRSRNLLNAKERDDTKGAIKSLFGLWIDKNELTPSFACRLHVSDIPASIVLRSETTLGELTFIISLYPQWERSTVVELPDIKLKACSIQLTARTGIHVYDLAKRKMQDFRAQEKLIKNLQVKNIDPPGPFHVMSNSFKHPVGQVENCCPAKHDGGRNGNAPTYSDRHSEPSAEPTASSRSRSCVDTRLGGNLGSSAAAAALATSAHTSTQHNNSAASEKALLAARMARLDMSSSQASSSSPRHASLDIESPGPSSRLPTVDHTPLETTLIKRITTMPIHGVPPTFATGNVSRHYDVIIHVELLVGKQAVGVTKTVPIILHARDSPVIAQGPPFLIGLQQHEQDDLPAYEDAVREDSR